MRFLKLLLPAGSDTTYRLIGNALFALLTHTEQFEEVRVDRAQIKLPAIEETLRWESPVQYASRETTAAVTLGGVALAAGDTAPHRPRLRQPRRAPLCRPGPLRHPSPHRRAHGLRLRTPLLPRVASGAAGGRLRRSTRCFDRLPNLRLDRHNRAVSWGLPSDRRTACRCNSMAEHASRLRIMARTTAAHGESRHAYFKRYCTKSRTEWRG